MNLLHLMGFLGADPEERYTSSGQKVWTLRVATRSYKNGQDETIWWRITVWGDSFDKILTHFKKGKPIYIVAEMTKLDIYTDKNGQPQVSYDATAKSIHFVASGERENQDSGRNGTPYSAPQGNFSESASSNSQAPSYNQVYNYATSDEPLPF